MKNILTAIVPLAIALFGTATAPRASAQPAAHSNFTFGLNRPFPEKHLPRSRVPIPEAVRVAKQHIEGKLEKISSAEYLIADGWEMREAYKVTESQLSPLKAGIPTDDWYNAVVPGTVLTTLVKNGVYPDPYWGLNNLSIPDTLCRMDWWYRVEFDSPENETRNRTRLVFGGINYRAEVWLNGKRLGVISGAFTRGVFDVTGMLRPTDNVLAVRILPPNNPGIPHEQNPHTQGNNGGLLCLDGPTFISSEGWDWVPGIRDRNIGIWQDVRLDYTNDVRLGDSQIITDLPLPDTTSAAITLKTSLHNSSSAPRKVVVTLRTEGVSVSKEVSLEGKASKPVVFAPGEFPALNLKNPRLWWPNGYGPQNLCTAEITVSAAGTETDRRTIRYGIREFDYRIAAVTRGGEELYIDFNPTAAYSAGLPVLDIANRVEVEKAEKVCAPKLLCELPAPGITPVSERKTYPYLVLQVNGVKVFCKGGNWGMDDAMKNVSREHLEPYLRLHRDQHFNMIRNWTGESTETTFFDLCDEYGILVFNDFWLSTEGYNLNAADEMLFMANVNETIIRHRNHPSIAVWCPRNEGFAPLSLEKDITASIASLDGTRHYIGSSIRLNTTGSGPWTPELPETYYRRDINRGFNSEIGAPCVPTAESMRKMMAEEDLWPVSDVWAYHTWLVGGWLRFQSWEQMVSEKYGEFTGIDDFCKKSQLFGYDVYRAIFEAANSRMWDNTSGVLLWMSHPAWPSMAYQTYTWDYETTGPYFGSKTGCKPIHIQMKLNDRTIQAINNTETHLKNVKVRALCYSPDGKLLSRKEITSGVGPNATASCFVHEKDGKLPEVYLLRLEMTDGKGRLLDRNDYWLNGPGGKNMQLFNSLPQTRIAVSGVKKSGTGKYTFTLRNEGASAALGVKLNLKGAASAASVLPAYFSDGYFTLLPGERRTVTLEFTRPVENPSVAVEGYNVPQQTTRL